MLDTFSFYSAGRLESGTTLFTYPPHKRYDDYIDARFTPDDNPEFSSRELEQQATLLCDGDIFCLYDIAITGLLEVGNLTKMTSQRRVELVDISRPSKISETKMPPKPGTTTIEGKIG